MATTSPTAKLTYADYLLLPEDGRRHELIDGEHYVSPSPNVRHQLVLRDLLLALHGFVAERELGEVLFAPMDVLLSDHDVVEPDLLYVARPRSALLEERYIHGAPDLVVEVLSPSTRGRDLGLKRTCYEKFGVAEYWIVDPEAETIEIFRQSPAASGAMSSAGACPTLEEVACLRRAAKDGPLTSPLFPGLAIRLDRIFG